MKILVEGVIEKSRSDADLLLRMTLGVRMQRFNRDRAEIEVAATKSLDLSFGASIELQSTPN
jgi:hypothetical protein